MLSNERGDKTNRFSNKKGGSFPGRAKQKKWVVAPRVFAGSKILCGGGQIKLKNKRQEQTSASEEISAVNGIFTEGGCITKDMDVFRIQS